MKKIMLIFAFGIFTNILFAQSAVTTMTGSGDTLKESAIEYTTIQPKIFYGQVSFEALTTKVSGTMSGYALLQSSLDGTNYIDENTDTLTFVDQTTNTKIWTITNNNLSFYRIAFVGGGTDTAKVYGYMWTTGGTNNHSVSNMLSSFGLTSDTCVNSATTYVGITVIGKYTTLGVQTVVTKISGTVAGTVTLQGSIDGTNYLTVQSAYSSAQTLSASDVTTQTKKFIITGSPYKYYRLSYTGTGTMSAKIKGYLIPNK